VETLKRGTALLLIVCSLLLLLPTSVHAWQPNARDRDAAIDGASLGPYFVKLTAWLNGRVPSSPDRITLKAMQALLGDRVFMDALAERQFMTKMWATRKPKSESDYAFQKGVRNFDIFVKADPRNRSFLRWVMSDGRRMNELCMGCTPCAWHWRKDDSHHINTTTLENWKRIYYADPASRQGLYLRPAIACVLRPPGSGNQGAGNAKKHGSVFDRYMHFRKAHAAGELFPSFDKLTVWELTHVVSSGASDADLTWGREALNTWNSSFRKGENVVGMVSQVWRRSSQVPYHDFSCVAAGGGKCGPRSSFGVFINQAFGIPAIGVGQPGHAAIAYRNMNGDWQIAQGRGWNVSKLVHMPGTAFLDMVRDRESGKFDKVEHLRWLAASIESPGAAPYEVPEYIMRRTGVRGVVPDQRYENPRAKAVYFLYEKLPDTHGKIKRTPFDRRPDEKSTLGEFKAPASAGEFYFSRVRGFAHPPASGDYIFSITSDDDSDLFLSTGADPDNKRFIACVQGWSNPNDFSRKSRPLRLERGRKYYIETVHRELDGGDHLTVAWKGPGVAEGVIPGVNLSPYPSGGKGTIGREVWFDNSKRAAPAGVKTRTESKPEAPVRVPPGVIHVEAEDFFNHSNTHVMDCYTGGKQVYFPSHTTHAWCGYKIDVPRTGTYRFTARVAVINWGQQLYVRSFGAMYRAKSAKASDVYRNQFDVHGPQFAVDDDLSTRWAMNFGKDAGWIELDLGRPRRISKIIIDERALNYVKKHQVDYKVGGEWKKLLEGDYVKNYVKSFPPVTAQYVRFSSFDTDAPTGGPTVREISVGDVFDGNGFIEIPWAPALEKNAKGDMAGRWQTTKPKDMYLVKGEQSIWVCTQTLPAQRSVAMRWFELKPKGR
jgi:hypothetical protein